MKTAIIASPLISSDNLESSIMGMDVSGMATAQMFLRDKIYSNKVLAVVREYACNAIDEHVKHNIQQPVEIGLRKDGDDIIFFVRDFACGLSDHDVRNVFGMYFKSTKCGSNASIGGFGIGSKSAHCYSDTFFVTSYFEGEKITYSCMLGGGDTGVPVGHIYEVDRCESDDTGLEIYLPIKRHESLRFSDTISEFVRRSTANIVYINIDGKRLSPSEILFQKQIEKLNVRLVKHGEHGEWNKDIAIIQMGGVTYGRVDFKSSGFSLADGTALLIDLPIGSMSIPISRESFEDTPSNNKVLQDIHTMIIDLAEADTAKFKDKKIVELFEDHLSGIGNNQYSGAIFTVRKIRLFKDLWPILDNLKQSNSLGTKQIKNSKPYLITIPNNLAKGHWINKLMEFSKNTHRNYYYCSSEVLHKASVDISQEFEIVCAKKLDYPKIKKQNKRYIVKIRNRSIGNFSALELHNYMRKQLSLSEAKDEKEALIQNQQFKAQITTYSKLAQLVIGDKHAPKKSFNINYYSNSEHLVTQMEDLGWLRFRSAQYFNLRKVIDEAETNKKDLDNSIKNCKREFFKFSQRTERLIETEPKKALRFVKFWKTIDQENSLRSKLLSSLRNSGSSVVYSREEFRKILKLQ